MNGNDPQTQLKAAFDRALAAYQAGAWANAEVGFRDFLKLVPDHPDALHLLGLSLHFQGRSDDGIGLIRRAIAVFSGNPAYHNNLGNVLVDCGNGAGAEAAYRRATEVRPDYPVAWQGLGTLAMVGKRPREAIGFFQSALQAAPNYAPAENGIGNVLLQLGRVEEAVVHYRAALRLDPKDRSAASNLLLAMQYDSTSVPSAICEAHHAWGAVAIAGIPPRTIPFANLRDPDRKLRIGYVSADFRRHSVAYFIEPVITAHDRTAVEVTLYADVPRPDRATARIRAASDRWQNIQHLDDAAAARLIEADGIDILIDLAGHTSGNRLGIFAHKPAPVQATWIGYPDVTGLPTIDWRLTDGIVDPDMDQGNGNRNEEHGESFFRLTEGFLCYRPPDEAPTVGAPPSGRNRPITFGSFNAFFKISSDSVALWAKVLVAVPGSRLLIKSEALGDPETRDSLLQSFACHGINADRLDLMGFIDAVDNHLAIYNRVDIGLDTIPYNGTTTTMEALWMGVPVVVLAGNRHAARVGASLLTRAGLADLVAETPDDYARIAATLAADRDRLAALRSGLRAQLAETTLIDAKRFTRCVEDAYRTMWRRYLSAGR
jgi:predicted O-linked N-acetylglucosamine transferase (SPINDLY family)